MRRRTLVGVAGLTLAVALLALALLVGGAAGGHGKGKGHANGKASNTHGRIGFHFLDLNQVAGKSDRLIIQGDGSFNRNRASGGGTFDHFLACMAPPACTLVATGTWKAEDVVSWSPGATHGVYQGGTLVIHATLKPIGQPAIKNVMIEVDCNLGPAGFTTGKTEGVIVTVPGGPVFTPAPQGNTPNTGLTIFSTTKGHKH
jgi:hypothetical protein